MSERTIKDVLGNRSVKGVPYVQVTFEDDDSGGEYYTPEEATDFGLSLIQAAAEAVAKCSMVRVFDLEDRIREMTGDTNA